MAWFNMPGVPRAALLGLVLALLSLRQIAAVPSIRLPKHLSLDKFEKPWFYHDLEGPEYKVLNSTDKYEVRFYEKATWASTNVDSILFSAATMTGFRRLFGYIQGANAQNKTIPMTVPVRVQVIPGEGPFCVNTFKVGFYVPKWMWEDVPRPKDSKIYIEETRSETFYVASYGGFNIDPIMILKAKSFISDLEGCGKPIDDKTFWSASYDPPFRLTGRHNEIWVAKLDEDNAKATH